MNDIDINVDELKSWIGNDEIVFDEVSKNLEKRFRATLDIDPGDPQNGEIASSGIHWALAPAVVKSSLLGKDSHPQKGGFLPPVALPRRMWAGCCLLYTSDAADDSLRVDLGGRRIIKKPERAGGRS